MSMMSDFQQLMLAPEDSPAFSEADHFFKPAETPPSGESSITALMRNAHATLVAELIARIHAQPPEFFEHLVIDVLQAMGYGSRRNDMTRRIGRTGDGGIDGLIAVDELGLDLIYIQAKRLRPGNPVPIAEVRDFAGSLEARHAVKGVFVTTSHFSPGAGEFCARISRRVVLIDGTRLAELMVRYNIGVKIKESYLLKHLDADYFTAAPRLRGEELSRSAGARLA